MTAAASERKSIRRSLVTGLASILLLLVALAAIFTYRGALNAANDAYDRSLLDPALDLAQNVSIDNGAPRLNLPPQALEALLYDQTDEAVFQVRAPTFEIVAGDPDLEPDASVAPATHSFSDAVYRGKPVRLVTLHSPNGFYVAVAETKHKRNRLVGEILVAELAPTLLIALASALVAWIGVARALALLARLRVELLRRSPDDLRPLTDAWAPVEIAPVIGAFNALLEQLRHASAVQRRFVENAAHQLRTPLAGLQMHLELLLRTRHPEPVRAELERLLTATRRESHLTNRLLALARAERSTEEPRSGAVVNLYALAGGAARRWVPRALDRGIDLGFSLDHATVVGDSVLLDELLDNLIDNALLYTPAGGTVTVACGERDGTAFISVEDSGPGIPVGERKNVVERFYRIAGAPGHGSGLGLSIVREVVERHGGTLDIGDGADGRGARLTITLDALSTKSDQPVAARA